MLYTYSFKWTTNSTKQSATQKSQLHLREKKGFFLPMEVIHNTAHPNKNSLSTNLDWFLLTMDDSFCLPCSGCGAHPKATFHPQTQRMLAKWQ